MSRDNILHKVRTALGRSAGQPAPALAPPRLRVPEVDLETRIARFSRSAREAWPASSTAPRPSRTRAPTSRPCSPGKTAVASNAPLLRECGITALDGRAQRRHR